uniref:Uncharacterized protein n=1 Tax=Aquisalinus luteolus TaxID=1566827 RepID=A0A8J3A4H0_9PROT|nr:hypothetical protein GCM10011355_31800 [Aquisalinus luteolus]
MTARRGSFARWPQSWQYLPRSELPQLLQMFLSLLIALKRILETRASVGGTGPCANNPCYAQLIKMPIDLGATSVARLRQQAGASALGAPKE